MKSLTIILGCGLIFFGCQRDLSGPSVIVNDVKITLSQESFIIYNGTESELRFFLVEQEVLAVLFWAPYCLPKGLIVPPKNSVTVEFEDIYGYKKDCLVVFHWWPCYEVDGKLQPGDIQSTVVSTIPE